MVAVMARAKEFDEQQALSAAVELFWRKGYEGTSVQDLVDATGVNRASLYATFGDKQQLFRKALAQFGDRNVKSLRELAATAGGGLHRIRAVFRLVAEQTLSDHRGCMVANAVTELSAREPWMAEIGESSREQIERIFLACLKEASAAGEIQPGKSNRATARFLTNSLFGLRVMAKMKPSRTFVQDIVRANLAVLK